MILCKDRLIQCSQSWRLPVVDEPKVIRKHGCFAKYACGQCGSCLLGIVGFYAPFAGVRPLNVTSRSWQPLAKMASLSRKHGYRNGIFSIPSAGASCVAVFASQPNRMEVDRSAASGISSVSFRRTLNAPKNTESGYSGLAPLYI